MTTPTEGDIVLSPKGRKWTVIEVRGEIVQAEEVDTFVVSHFRADELTVLEKHPGGRGGPR